MIRRRPLSFTFSAISIVSLVLVFTVSYYFLLATIILFLLRFQVPLKSSKCPRCRKDNQIEQWVTEYPCACCKAELLKESNGWSRMKEKGSPF